MEGLDQFITLPRGLDLHYVEWGDKAAPPLVLLHGWMDIARSWDPVARRLSKNYRVLALDFRGHGLSDCVGAGGNYDFNGYAVDILSLIEEATGGGPVILIGHSMGGMAGSKFAGAFPEKIRKFINVEGFGPPAMPPDVAPKRLAEWVKSWLAQAKKERKPYASVEEAAARLRKQNPRLSEEFSLHLSRHGTEKGEDGAYRWRFDPLHKTPGSVPFDLEAAKACWRQIKSPTLVVVGELSEFKKFIPDWRERVAVYPNARIAEIAGAGHMIHHEKPEELTTTIEGFLVESGK